jgi:hypothetical protein
MCERQIQGYIVGDGRDSRETEFVVIASILDRSVAILADVHATDFRELPASQVFTTRSMPWVATKNPRRFPDGSFLSTVGVA